MKQFIECTLFIAFLAVAVLGVGAAETGGAMGITIIALVAIVALMMKSGMIARPLTKEEVETY